MFRLLPFLFAVAALPLRAEEVTFLVGGATEMPMARFKGWDVVEGIHYDLSHAMAREMGRRAKFVVLPRQRMAEALREGSADLACTYIPQWLGGADFRWSRPFLPMTEVLLTNGAVARPRRVRDVAGQPIATVLGYRHPEFEKALGHQFVREDGPTTEVSLRKLAAGLARHAITNEHIYAYRLKVGDLPLTLHPPLVVKRYMSQCALSPKSRLRLAEVDAALAHLLRDGTIANITAKYR